MPPRCLHKLACDAQTVREAAAMSKCSMVDPDRKMSSAVPSDAAEEASTVDGPSSGDDDGVRNGTTFTQKRKSVDGGKDPTPASAAEDEDEATAYPTSTLQDNLHRAVNEDGSPLNVTSSKFLRTAGSTLGGVDNDESSDGDSDGSCSDTENETDSGSEASSSADTTDCAPTNVPSSVAVVDNESGHRNEPEHDYDYHHDYDDHHDDDDDNHEKRCTDARLPPQQVHTTEREWTRWNHHYHQHHGSCDEHAKQRRFNGTAPTASSTSMLSQDDSRISVHHHHHTAIHYDADSPFNNHRSRRGVRRFKLPLRHAVARVETQHHAAHEDSINAQQNRRRWQPHQQVDAAGFPPSHENAHSHEHRDGFHSPPDPPTGGKTGRNAAAVAVPCSHSTTDTGEERHAAPMNDGKESSPPSTQPYVQQHHHHHHHHHYHHHHYYHYYHHCDRDDHGHPSNVQQQTESSVPSPQYRHKKQSMPAHPYLRNRHTTPAAYMPNQPDFVTQIVDRPPVAHHHAPATADRTQLKQKRKRTELDKRPSKKRPKKVALQAWPTVPTQLENPMQLDSQRPQHERVIQARSERTQVLTSKTRRMAPNLPMTTHNAGVRPKQDAQAAKRHRVTQSTANRQQAKSTSIDDASSVRGDIPLNTNAAMAVTAPLNVAASKKAATTLSVKAVVTNGSKAGSTPTASSQNAPKTAQEVVASRHQAVQSTKWNLQYEQLVKFRAEHGDCAVPRTGKGNPKHHKLALWIKWQRQQYKRRQRGESSTLTDERVRLLDTLGFAWDAQKAAWDDQFRQLKQFYKVHGHCRITSRNAQNTKLATWVKTQRRLYRQFQAQEKASNAAGQAATAADACNTEDEEVTKGEQDIIKFTRERIDQLNSINFVWHPTSTDSVDDNNEKPPHEVNRRHN